MSAYALCGLYEASFGGCRGPLLGPMATDQQTGIDYDVHWPCAVWSPEVYQTNEVALRLCHSGSEV